MDMDERDSDHWLWRLSAGAWLEAAVHELEQGTAVLSVRRSAVTHARRAAGMGLNGVLVAMAARGWSPGRSEAIWGRSYIDHLRTLANPELDPQVREPFEAEFTHRCRELLAIPVMPSTGSNELVRLARARDEAAISALGVARQIVDDCVGVVGINRS
jgi:hypothetical protein